MDLTKICNDIYSILGHIFLFIIVWGAISRIDNLRSLKNKDTLLENSVKYYKCKISFYTILISLIVGFGVVDLLLKTF